MQPTSRTPTHIANDFSELLATPHNNTNQPAIIMTPEIPNNYNDHDVPFPAINATLTSLDTACQSLNNTNIHMIAPELPSESSYPPVLPQYTTVPLNTTFQ